MPGGGHEPTHGEDQSVRWSRATLVNRDCVFAGEGLCKSGLGARTENSQEPGLIRERDDGPGCSIPGLRRMCIFFRIRLTPQMAVSECPGQGPQDHSLQMTRKSWLNMQIRVYCVPRLPHQPTHTPFQALGLGPGIFPGASPQEAGGKP